MRRWHPNLDPQRVHLLGMWSFALARLLGGLPSRQKADALVWAFDRFDRAAAQWLETARTPAIVHGFEGTSLHFLEAGRRLGARTILDAPSAHELFSELALRSGASSKLVLQTTKRVRRERAAADFILAPSDFVVDRLMDIGVEASRIIKIPYGAHLPPPHTERPRGTFTALFVGQVSARKGIDDLLGAWARFDRRPSQLVVVGAIAADSEASVRAAPPNVKFLGFLSGPDLSRAYAHADIFVFPSRAEGSARVVYEAMAAGLPVLTTRQAGSVVTDGVDGIVIEAGDRRALLLGLERLFDNQTGTSRMAANARQTIEQRYTWSEYRRKVAELYRDVSSRPRN
jgi:glycosyltransferase involved in cell wall biosynthesis